MHCQNTVVIHSYKQACAAFKAAQDLDKEITILSPAHTHNRLGSMGYKRLIEKASNEIGFDNYQLIIDCHNKAYPLYQAIKNGYKYCLTTLDKNDIANFNDLATENKVTFLNEKPYFLDLLQAGNRTYDACLDYFKDNAVKKV